MFSQFSKNQRRILTAVITNGGRAGSVLARFILYFSLTLVSGCIMDSPIVRDMEAAYQKNKQENVSTVVQKYFPSGMKLSEALKQLQESGFEITESKKEGFRRWPNGELWLYKDEGHRRAALSGASFVYSAKKFYDYHLIFKLITKRASIVIDSDGEQVLSSRGLVYLDGM